ncbi:alpha/beta fold hydrolase [Mycobacterium sp. IS-3022]|uniref:alpha/beta fold hydrolase n=1 Tax=Mycobacterium sp. IS-3022 TaxID=1772277 RepID=UPI0007415234|nr:alpha/beta fold hydrolase [Mycobacterium sp. IS-3022]KUI03733.1 alpha/beta hydrolase [Mycobacterium sp. IS-3022]
MTVELSQETTAKEVMTDGGVLRYHEFGDGPPLVLLHGSGPGVTGWRDFRGVLGAFGEFYRCLVLEFPGFGVSDDFGGHPMVTAHDALTRFVDALPLDSVDIVGNSTGGTVAIQYAIDHPKKVRRLVTIGGIGRSVFSPGPAEGIRLLHEFAENPTKDRLVQWLHSMVYDKALVTDELIEERWTHATQPATLASARRMYSKAAFEQMVQAMEAADGPQPWAAMHRVKAPILITWGRDDRVSPLDMALIPMRTIPNAELHVFPNCGHWAMVEQRDAFVSTVLSFLLHKDGG